MKYLAKRDNLSLVNTLTTDECGVVFVLAPFQHFGCAPYRGALSGFWRSMKL